MTMRPLQVLGIVLVIVGVVILWLRPTYQSRQDIVTIGDVKASVEQREGIPLWIGAAVAGGGVLLVLVGSRRPG